VDIRPSATLAMWNRHLGGRQYLKESRVDREQRMISVHADKSKYRKLTVRGGWRDGGDSRATHPGLEENFGHTMWNKMQI
jgi:hypothetical protein